MNRSERDAADVPAPAPPVASYLNENLLHATRRLAHDFRGALNAALLNVEVIDRVREGEGGNKALVRLREDLRRAGRLGESLIAAAQVGPALKLDDAIIIARLVAQGRGIELSFPQGAVFAREAAIDALRLTALLVCAAVTAAETGAGRIDFAPCQQAAEASGWLLFPANQPDDRWALATATGLRALGLAETGAPTWEVAGIGLVLRA